MSTRSFRTSQGAHWIFFSVLLKKKPLYWVCQSIKSGQHMPTKAEQSVISRSDQALKIPSRDMIQQPIGRNTALTPYDPTSSDCSQELQHTLCYYIKVYSCIYIERDFCQGMLYVYWTENSSVWASVACWLCVIMMLFLTRVLFFPLSSDSIEEELGRHAKLWNFLRQHWWSS